MPKLSPGPRMALLCLTLAFLSDWATKSWALNTVRHQPLEWGAIRLLVVENDAFAFSTGAGLLPAWAVASIRLTALVACVVLVLWHGHDKLRILAGVGLLAGGGLGNLADLLVRGAAVVDFIGVRAMHPADGRPLEVYANLADLWIFASVGLVLPAIRSGAQHTRNALHSWQRRLLARLPALGRERALEP